MPVVHTSTHVALVIGFGQFPSSLVNHRPPSTVRHCLPNRRSHYKY
nr:MAG TPA: hypothetical protein [Caudoviricetes sp.]